MSVIVVAEQYSGLPRYPSVAAVFRLPGHVDELAHQSALCSP